MTITLVLPNPPAYSETFFRSKIKGLLNSGHQVILVTAATADNYKECQHVKHPRIHKIPVLQLLHMVWVYLGLMMYIGRVIRYSKLERAEGVSFKRILEKIYLNATLLKLNTDWVHFGFATMAINRELVAKAIKAKSAVSFRGYDIGVYPLKNPNCYLLLWQHIDKVHYISDDLYQKACGLGLSRTITHQKITPAINTELFNPPQSTLKEPMDTWVFITIGRLHWKKGYVDTLKALKVLKNNNIKFKYHIIGDGPEYERIAFAAYQLGISDDVIFHGRLNHDQVKEYLSGAHIYLQYSIQEGFCNAVLEAQALGKLCVVSDAEGLSENVLDQQTGWVVPKLQPYLLSDALLKVIELSISEKKAVADRAIKRVQAEFNLEQQKEKFNQFY